MSSRRSLAFIIFVPLISIVLFVAMAETGLRLIGIDTMVENRFFVLNRALDYPDVFLKDRELFWRLRPDQEIKSRFFEHHTFRINSLGLRGDPIDSIKTRPRLMMLGNSCTFGWATPERTTFPRQLSWRLGNDYEIINAGIPGYTSFQGKTFFNRDLIDLEPDILLVMFAWNDHWASASEIADKDQQFPPEGIISLQNTLSNLESYRLLKKVWLSCIEEDVDSTFSRENPEYRVGLDDFSANLREISRLAQTNGVVPILMTSPIPSLEDYYARGMVSPMHQIHEKYNQATRHVASSEGISLIDLAVEFDSAKDLWDDPLNDPIHFNARGHTLAGLVIATYLRRNILLEPDSTAKPELESAHQ